MKLALDSFKNFFKYYAAEEHQEAAIEQFYADLPDELKQDESLWVKLYRKQVVEPAPTPAPAPAPEPTPAPTEDHELAVTYYSQRDNYRDASRTCFSSATAMALNYVKPGAISNDDDYIHTVFSIGDTTEAWVHVKALAEYGVDSEFRQDCTQQTIKDQIDKGFPVPVGILHKGPANSPTGGGHWITVIGYDERLRAFVVHDPWGEIDNASGTYISEDGEHLYYSYNMFSKRWTVDHDNDGWAIIVKSVEGQDHPKT